MSALANRRGAGSRRRAMGEINMVPFIDVMLVLLVIFMVTAPLITSGVVDLPSVGRAAQRPAQVVEVLVSAEGALRLRADASGRPRTGATDSEPVVLTDLVQRVGALQGGKMDAPVVISADRQVRYEEVVKVMDTLHRGGLQRVGLSVKQGADPAPAPAARPKSRG